ncbi:MAG: PKD domain-containing protein [Prolixibacteraceae bacterium]
MKTFLLLTILFTGLFASAQDTIVTNGNCKAYFKHEVNTLVMTILPATAINFYDESEGKAYAWFWDFGDGGTSNEQNPMYVFNHPLPGPTVKISPYRTVSLTILTQDSCKSMYSETINIMDGNTGTDPVLACKSIFKYYQTAYDSIAGTASFQTTNYSEGDSLSYLWNFDNESTSTEFEPAITFDLSKKERKVCLTVSGPNGCIDEFCDAMYVYDHNKPVVEPMECKTAFGYSVNYDIKTFAAALVLDFYSKASPEAIEWNWDFGDGTTSDEANPTHIFNFPVITDSILADPNPFRNVCLTVKTTTGCVATYCDVIDIYKETFRPEEPAHIQCRARFKYYKPTDLITIPEVVAYQFNDASEGNIINRLWKFEDGTVRTDADPQVNFNIFQATQKVCLTIFTDSCSDTYCETVYVSEIKPDTIYYGRPVTGYSMHYSSSFPIQMSSCAGYAKAQVYLNDTLIEANDYAWSNGAIGQEVKGLCPTEVYTVKAMTADGTIVSGTFIFNSDGTVTEIPMNWWVTGAQDNLQLRYNIYNQDYSIEWKLCDGTIIKSDSIPLNSVNCGTEDATLIMKDASGNILYTENVSMKTFATGLIPKPAVSPFKVYPNPVSDVLNIQYSGRSLNAIQIDLVDISGKVVSTQQIYQVEPGQTISLNVNSLRKGMYVCKISSENQSINVAKFIK